MFGKNCNPTVYEIIPNNICTTNFIVGFKPFISSINPNKNINPDPATIKMTILLYLFKSLTFSLVTTSKTS